MVAVTIFSKLLLSPFSRFSRHARGVRPSPPSDRSPPRAGKIPDAGTPRQCRDHPRVADMHHSKPNMAEREGAPHGRSMRSGGVGGCAFARSRRQEMLEPSGDLGRLRRGPPQGRHRAARDARVNQARTRRRQGRSGRRLKPGKIVAGERPAAFTRRSYQKRSIVRPSRSMSGSRPATRSAVTRPEPHASVQPMAPWPVLK